MSDVTWELIDAEVREYSFNGDQRAKDLFAKAIAAAEARGYARAKEQGMAILLAEEADLREPGGDDAAAETVSGLASRIRAMKDEA